MGAAAIISPTLYPSQRPRNGWFKNQNQYFPARAKLIHTLVQERIVQIIERETCNTTTPMRTRLIPVEEFAAYSGCTIRAVEYGLNDLLERGVIERVSKVARKGSAYSIPYHKWPSLAELKTVPISEIVPESPDDEPEPEIQSPPLAAPAPIPVVPNWKLVSVGGRTKPVKLPSAVHWFRIRAHRGALYRAHIINDVLTLELSGEEYANAVPDGISTTVYNVNDIENQHRTNNVSDSFDRFQSGWLAHGINAGVQDWAEARRLWARLGTAEQLRAVEGVRLRFEAGEYDDPKWIPLPQKYLANQSWMRPVRPRKLSKDDELRLKIEAGRARARARDMAEGRLG